jgi:hypothetical protein
MPRVAPVTSAVFPLNRGICHLLLGKEECSFLKKRTKRLLIRCTRRKGLQIRF